MKLQACVLAGCCCLFTTAALDGDGIVYEGADGPGKGKHIVFLTGDEEYRSEEGLPMLAKILSQKHGFKCTVLFAVDRRGAINPNKSHSLPGAEALDSADLRLLLETEDDLFVFTPVDTSQGTVSVRVITIDRHSVPVSMRITTVDTKH